LSLSSDKGKEKGMKEEKETTKETTEGLFYPCNY
jgi:hypothetical protein